MRNPRMPTIILAVLTLLISGLTVLAASSASANVPRLQHAFGAAIEPDTAYAPQDDCDATPRHGTTMLGNLLVRTYRGSTWSSYRPCDGSVSEHHDFRAVDWMVSSRNKVQRTQGYDFATWLLATDRAGNHFAMARRLGVMYIIFDGRIWGGWDGKWTEYMHCRTTQTGAAYDNACHRTHMHISLSWNGARGLTSFWTGGVWRTDYGPCRARGKKYAPRWSHRNFAGCP